MTKYDVEVEVKIMFQVEADSPAEAGNLAIQNWDQHTSEEESDTLFVDVYNKDGEVVYSG
jgi:hypothetical protein